MNRIHPVRHVAGILAGLAGALLAFTAISPPAFAYRLPPSGGPAGTVTPPVHAIVTGGMPGWQIALIAAAAALIAAATALVLDRARAARRHLPAPNA